jgi:DNA-directed RNA polymerase specialized sigma24 family protein
MPYQEIADALGIAKGTVKSRLSRARLAVKRCLQNVSELLPPEFRLADNG